MKLSDGRQSCGATSAALLGRFVTWGVPFRFFRRLLHSIFSTRRKNFNSTADTCTFVDTAWSRSRETLLHASISSARIWICSALHLVDHHVPHIDIELKLV